MAPEQTSESPAPFGLQEADPSIPQLVQLPSGTISLVTLDHLRTQLSALRADIAGALKRRGQLMEQVSELNNQMGAALAGRRAEWDTSGCQAELAMVDSIKAQIDEVDSQITALSAEHHKGLGRLLHAVSDKVKETNLGRQRDHLAGEMSAALRQLAAKAPASTVAAADTLRAQLTALGQEIADGDARAAHDQERAAVLESELAQRETSVKEMGFDALYLSAYLKSHGPDAVESPLILKRGEEAWLTAPATLGRQKTKTQFVGGSQGVSFPVGHTGIRYRVGSYRGHPVQQEYLARLDTGTLVLTNQRIAYVGHTKSTSTPLAKILHVECYADALAVFSETRETPDFYFLAAPKHYLFCLNWALGRAAE